jgi:hypothetical protein
MRIIVVVLVFLLLTSCAELTSSDKEKVDSRAYQIPGCIPGLLRDRNENNTGFSYVFDDTLSVDLSLNANCCPDSNRFDYSFIIVSDTIKFSVVDTAENLCRCICDYIVHADMIHLEQDTYIFKCIYYDSVYYQQEVVRK